MIVAVQQATPDNTGFNGLLGMFILEKTALKVRGAPKEGGVNLFFNTYI